MFPCRKQAAFLQVYQAVLFLPLLTQEELNTFFSQILFVFGIHIHFLKWFYFSFYCAFWCLEVICY